MIVVARAAGCERPRGPRSSGLLAKTCGRLDQAAAHLEDAIEIATRMGDRPALAISRVDLAEVLLARDGRGDRERALELLGEAISAGARDGRALDRRAGAARCASRPRGWRGWT